MKHKQGQAVGLRNEGKIFRYRIIACHNSVVYFVSLVGFLAQGRQCLVSNRIIRSCICHGKHGRAVGKTDGRFKTFLYKTNCALVSKLRLYRLWLNELSVVVRPLS